MKALLPVLLTFALLSTVPVPAQTNSAPPEQHKMLSFLTQEEQDKVESAHQKVLAGHPDLKQEEDDLRTKAQAAFGDDATNEQREAFREAMQAHTQKIRAAMLKEDPSVAPIFKKIDEHRSEMRAKHEAEQKQ